MVRRRDHGGHRTHTGPDEHRLLHPRVVTDHAATRQVADLAARDHLLALQEHLAHTHADRVGDLVREVRERVFIDALAAGLMDDGKRLANYGSGAAAYADAVATYLGIAASKQADGNSTLCTWMAGVKYEVVRTTFSRQALSMTWDFAESNPFAASSGDYFEQVKRAANALQLGIVIVPGRTGKVVQADAASASRGDSLRIFSTDPPYYDNIGYADLSDFFYVWLRRSLLPVFPGLLTTMLVPKEEELVATPFRFGGSKEKANQFFEEGFVKAFGHMWGRQHPDYPLTVYYAFKQAEDDDERPSCWTGECPSRSAR